jgi:uncharacterized cupin superfamily protein
VSKSIVMATPTCLELKPLAIPVDWILSGTPQAWYGEVSRSDDRISQTVVWECTEGLFRWHYYKEESVVVLSGEAFLIDQNGREIPFRQGDVGLFPAGTTCTWRVPGRFRKVAVLREPILRPIGYAARAWNRGLRMIGFASRPTLVGLDHASLSSSPRQAG